MSKIEVNAIEPQCGTTLTLGASGDTITLGAGATSSGFGATYNGAVNWDTTAKTTNFTAVSGNGYFVNTTSGAITVTLPTSPSAGDIVALADYASTWGTNNVTLTSALFNGTTGSPILSTKGQGITFVYVDGTRGWKAVQDNTQNISGATFIVATGGTITTCGDYKIHTFTSPGTFCVSEVGNPSGSISVDYLVVAGGAGGAGGSTGPSGGGGGGGAGGYRESHSVPVSGCYTASPLASATSLPVSVTGYPVTIGAGGPGGPAANSKGGSGSNSVFSTITSTGGGGGGYYLDSPSGANNPGNSGGSGGGAAGGTPGTPSTGGNGNSPPVSPPQGNNGGNSITGVPGAYFSGAGGGGATSTGTSITATSPGGPGGSGATTSISGSPTAYAGGGGGSGGTPASPGGTGGSGGGGAGASNPPVGGTAGTANTGGGGGGSWPGQPGSSGAGGSGIVIIRYKYQ